MQANWAKQTAIRDFVQPKGYISLTDAKSMYFLPSNFLEIDSIRTIEKPTMGKYASLYNEEDLKDLSIKIHGLCLIPDTAQVLSTLICFR